MRTIAWFPFLAASLLASLVHGADAPAAIPGLSNTSALLSPGEREAIANAGIQTGNWNDMAQTLRKTLLADRNSFASSNPAWNERLKLCEVLSWLGQNELEQGAIYLYGRVADRDKEGKFSVEKFQEALRNPNFAKQASSAFVDEEDYPHDQMLAQRFKPETLLAILTNAAFVEQLAETVSRDDYLPGVARILSDLHQHAPFTFGQFPALAVALAVVYDQPLPPGWPHHQVRSDAVPLAFGNWNGLFDYFTEEANAHDLLTDIQKLRADQLKFMVDIPLKVDELQWARKNIRSTRSRFDEVFSSIVYDRARIKANVYVWPGNDYLLATISKSGGICVDQAYFAVMSGKARGLPTLYFSGQGADGGHAWFGYLRNDDKWIMDAGRYANQNYVTGHAYDPQNWKEINDHQLEAITSHVTQSPDYRQSSDLLVLATMSDADGDNAPTFELLQSSLKACPANSAAWIAMADFLRSTKQTDLLKQHLQAMSAQFDNQGDMKAYALQQLIEIAKAEGDTTTTASLQQQIISANHLHRSDLGISAGSEVLSEKLAAKDYQGAYTEFKKLIRRFKTDGGGNLFYDIVWPFVVQLNDAGENKLAQLSLDYAKDYIKPTPDSTIDKGFAKLSAKINSSSGN